MEKWIQKEKLLAKDRVGFASFGASVSLDGTIALIGANLDDENGSNAGAAYVFERNNEGNWQQSTKLLPENGEESDRFGISVSLDGTTALVGAFLNDDKWRRRRLSVRFRTG